MGRYTRYLTVLDKPDNAFQVSVCGDSSLTAIRNALASSASLRYSPILPAYLVPGELPTPPPETLSSVAFFFSTNAYHTLGAIKPGLTHVDRGFVYFSQGLASVVVLQLDLERIQKLQKESACPQVEFWRLSEGELSADCVQQLLTPRPPSSGLDFTPDPTGVTELDVYLEQIWASIGTLWPFYGAYAPEEQAALRRIIALLENLKLQYLAFGPIPSAIDDLRQQNSIVAALVELSAALSYCVTQGTSGAPPILSNRSPFPHHSLLGVGSSVRALTKFTRYLEAAFSVRSAAQIIERQYTSKRVQVPEKISQYSSGTQYAFRLPEKAVEEFDAGGDFRAVDPVPLLANFSLRHGFKEAKFSITAASEALTAECLPPWTLMTLSHEIMHSRVRDIFQALFGTTWERGDADKEWDEIHKQFAEWYAGKTDDKSLSDGIRGAILNFCCAVERGRDVVRESRSADDKLLSRDDVLACYQKHRRLAIELFVHFHDYYFAYACQPKLYIMSLWVSWAAVAAPVSRPLEYLVRTLATVACGTGAEPRAAFDASSDLLLDGLDALEAAGRRSPLYQELRSILEFKSEAAYAQFKLAYYLIDQVRKNFASRIIVAKIDRIETDPFAEGSSVAADYSASIYVHGEPGSRAGVSPIRYSLASLVRQLSSEPLLDDVQWLTAWNSMVIASQEVEPC